MHKDRSLKADLYARAGVPEYWVVNLAERQIEIRTVPRDGLYTKLQIARPGDVIRSAALDGVAIAVSDFLR